MGHHQRIAPAEIRLALVEERERRRIACGLHDDVGQTLAVLQTRLAALEGAETSPERANELRGLRRLVSSASEATRTLTFELASPVLHELGFEPALRSLCDRFRDRLAVTFKLEAMGSQRCELPRDVGVILHRCVRELLRNVVDHAQATEVHVRLSMVSKRVEVSLEDDGVGFDPDTMAKSFTPNGGYGLYSIREQVDYLGGRVEIASSQGNGTRIMLAVPVGSVAGLVRCKTAKVGTPGTASWNRYEHSRSCRR